MRRRSATDRTRRPARSHRRQTNGSGALRCTPPPSPSPLDPPTPRHPPPLWNSQGGGGTLGGELLRRPTLRRPTGYVPRPPARRTVLRRGQHVKTTPRGLRTYRQTWLVQTTNAHQPDMPGFTPEPPGSQPSFALQQKPQSERPLLRGSTPSTYKFNNKFSNNNSNSNSNNGNSNILRQHPAPVAPGGFRVCRNAQAGVVAPDLSRLPLNAANARRGVGRSASHARLVRLTLRVSAFARCGTPSTHPCAPSAIPPAHPAMKRKTKSAAFRIVASRLPPGAPRILLRKTKP